MSHTTEISVKSGSYYVIHNGDWSGIATIFCRGSGEPLCEVPGDLLRSISRSITLSEVSFAFESMIDELHSK